MRKSRAVQKFFVDNAENWYTTQEIMKLTGLGLKQIQRRVYYLYSRKMLDKERIGLKHGRTYKYHLNEKGRYLL